jgi:hypothetical protein
MVHLPGAGRHSGSPALSAPSCQSASGRYGLALAAAVTLLLAVGFGAVVTTPAWSAGLGPLDVLVAGGPTDQRLPAAAANGPFLVTWQTRIGDDEDVYAARVRGDGTVVDTSAILIDAAAGEPDVARSSGHDWAVISEHALSHRTVSPK